MLVRVDPAGAETGDELERLLRSVAGASSGLQIARTLREASLFVLQHPSAQLSDADVAAGRISLAVQDVGGRSVVAVYSSQPAVERLAPTGMAYVGLPGATLLGMWSAGDWLFINPGARYQLIVSPDEVEKVRLGTDDVIVTPERA